MTVDEQERLRKSFLDLWRSVWGLATPRECLQRRSTFGRAQTAGTVATLADINQRDNPAQYTERQTPAAATSMSLRVACAMRGSWRR
jgi:hypothetical protein